MEGDRPAAGGASTVLTGWQELDDKVVQVIYVVTTLGATLPWLLRWL